MISVDLRALRVHILPHLPEASPWNPASHPGILCRMEANPLDEAVRAARASLSRRGAPEPDVLVMLGTGAMPLPEGMRSVWRGPLEGVSGVPRCWRTHGILATEAQGACFWFFEDSPGDDAEGNAVEPGEPTWARGFPIWLAAGCGASLCVHVSAGRALPTEEREPLPAGSLAFARDHINLSGGSPLIGLGGSTLGPLFPDQTAVHHRALRGLALRRATERGIPCAEAVVACVAGPAMETPAEQRYHARAGAEVSVQGLADPLIAMAHAGLTGLSIVAVIAGAEPSSIPHQLREAQRLAPALDELLSGLTADIAGVALELAAERS